MMGAYNRDVSRRRALRKKRMTEHDYWHRNGEPYYDNLHQYSKNKIHCSCPMCASKTKTDGRKHSEEVRILYMNEDEKTFDEEKEEE